MRAPLDLEEYRDTEMTGPPGYGERPCLPELVAIILVGVLHVVTEVGLSGFIARIYNAVVSLGFLVYLIWRARSTPHAVRAWGMRRRGW